MTETVADVGSLEKKIKKTAFPGEVERAAIRELVLAARARGEDLTGPDGLLKVLMTGSKLPSRSRHLDLHRTDRVGDHRLGSLAVAGVPAGAAFHGVLVRAEVLAELLLQRGLQDRLGQRRAKRTP